jgi:hypothetical protein
MEVNNSILLSIITFIWFCIWMLIVNRQSRIIRDTKVINELCNTCDQSHVIIDCKIIHLEKDICKLQSELHKIRTTLNKNLRKNNGQELDKTT